MSRAEEDKPKMVANVGEQGRMKHVCITTE